MSSDLIKIRITARDALLNEISEQMRLLNKELQAISERKREIVKEQTRLIESWNRKLKGE